MFVHELWNDLQVLSFFFLLCVCRSLFFYLYLIHNLLYVLNWPEMMCSCVSLPNTGFWDIYSCITGRQYQRKLIFVSQCTFSSCLKLIVSFIVWNKPWRCVDNGCLLFPGMTLILMSRYITTGSLQKLWAFESCSVCFVDSSVRKAVQVDFMLEAIQRTQSGAGIGA